jgi:phosphoserine phosphatase
MNKEYCDEYCYQKHQFGLIKKPTYTDRLSLVLFDMDGVLVDAISSWRFIHNYFSTNNQASVKAYIDGEIDDLEFIKRDVHRWKINNKLISKEFLGTILDDVTYIKGARYCLKQINKFNIKTAIVSAGIKLLADRVAHDLNIDYVFANELLTDNDGLLTGSGIVQVPLKQKNKAVIMISEKLNIKPEEMLAVGNSCFDIPMLSSVGIGVAFNPGDECVIKRADEVINYKDLSLLIPIIKKYLHN